MYLIESGAAVATKNQEGGDPEVVFKHQTGDYFGELSLLGHDNSPFNVVAEVKNLLFCTNF